MKYYCKNCGIEISGRGKTGLCKKCVMQSKEYKDKQRKISIEVWNSSEYKEKMSKIRKESWKNNKERRKKQSESMTKTLNDLYKSESYHKDQSNRAKKNWESDDYRNKVKNGERESWKREKSRTKKTQKAFKEFLTKEFRKVKVEKSDWFLKICRQEAYNLTYRYKPSDIVYLYIRNYSDSMYKIGLSKNLSNRYRDSKGFLKVYEGEAKRLVLLEYLLKVTFCLENKNSEFIEKHLVSKVKKYIKNYLNN